MTKQSDLHIEEIFHTERRGSYLELPLTARVFIFVGVLVVLIALIVLFRASQLTVGRGSFYNERAYGNANREIIIPAPRGVIKDRFGIVLAKNKSSFSVWVDVPELLRDRSQFQEAIRIIATITEQDIVDIANRIRESDIERQPIVKVVDDISVEMAIELKGFNLEGVQVSDDFVRNYPEPRVFAHVVGYKAEAGLEGSYNEYLAGRDGKEVVYRDVSGKILGEREIVLPEPGKELKTTIDAEFQKYFYNRLVTGLRNLGRTSGVGIALNPQNGEVLALLSLPSFDNNNIAEYLDAPNQPFFNRAVSGEYNPGSAIKPLHALAALREKIVTPRDQFFSSGRLVVPNPYDPEAPSVFLDWAPHGWVDLYSALARSSNVYFYHIGGGYHSDELTTRGLGIQKLGDYWRAFGLGEKTGIAIPAEGNGFLPNPQEKESRTGEIWRIGDTYNVAIGQGALLLTPIQLISFIASVGNGGFVYRPVIVDDGESKTLFDYSSWQDEILAVQKGLTDAVAKPYGTARLLRSLPVSAAGKTGSAQVANNTRTNAFFVGYMPAENPEIAVLILVENALEGSLNAVPIARDVFGWYYENRIR